MDLHGPVDKRRRGEFNGKSYEGRDRLSKTFSTSNRGSGAYSVGSTIGWWSSDGPFHSDRWQHVWLLVESKWSPP